MTVSTVPTLGQSDNDLRLETPQAPKLAPRRCNHGLSMMGPISAKEDDSDEPDIEEIDGYCNLTQK